MAITKLSIADPHAIHVVKDVYGECLEAHSNFQNYVSSADRAKQIQESLGQINNLIIKKRAEGKPLTNREIIFIKQNTKNESWVSYIFEFTGLTQLFRAIGNCFGMQNVVYRGFREYWTNDFNQHVKEKNVLDDKGRISEERELDYDLRTSIQESDALFGSYFYRLLLNTYG